MEPTPDQMRQAISRRDQTVSNPQRMAYPGIYKRPDVIASEAAARVAPEDPILKQLFGVTRADMYEQAKDRQGMPHLGKLPGGSAKPQGTDPASSVMTKRNEQRLLDVLDEAKGHQGLVHGMEPWYYMDPLFQHMVRLHGMEKAIHEYKKMNALMGMASSASEVTAEIPRGSLAYWLQNQGRFNEFVEHGGKRSPDRPADFGQTPGHLAHKTAHARPMQKFLNRGEVDMGSPKVPMYIEASGVPQTGFQTTMPVGDAHWSRAVGLADTRPKKTVKGEEVVPGASATNAEMSVLGPWWQHDIAHKMGLQSVPAQALAWGAFSPQTGVTTPIGAPKLELIAQQIRLTAKRLGVSPETARDMVLTGKARMGLAEGGAVGYAEGGAVKEEPSKDEMLAHVMLRKDKVSLKDIGANEAPNMPVKAYTSPGMGKGMPVGGVDFQPENPGQQMLPGQPGQPPGQPPQAGGPPGAPGQPPAPAGGPPGAPPGAPPGMPGMPPPGGPQGPRSNILQMTPQGQAMAAMRPNPAPMKPGMPMPKMADGGSVDDMRRAIANAAKSAGMKAPVVANKALTTMQDTYESLNDKVRKGATEMQDTIESMPHKYEKGQRVFTKDSAKKNKAPYTILYKYPFGGQPMREDHPKLPPGNGIGKPIKDPATGKTKRTPYEPGYKVRSEQDGGWSEFHIPESAIVDKLARGGTVKAKGYSPLDKLMGQTYAKGGAVEVRPTVKDEAIQRKVPEMEAAAKALQAGDITRKEYDKVVQQHKPVKPYTFVPKPASDKDADRALMENKKPQWRGHEQWPAGRKVGLRLDIPAYEHHGVWVNSVHDEEGSGKDKYPTAYHSVSSVKNATFDASPEKAVRVATGEQNKAPFARIKGELHHMSEDEAVEHMKAHLNHPDWAQVGMDPRRHGFFYDRKTLKPVTHSAHVVQIGPLVLAHKPTYGKRETYAKGGTVSRETSDANKAKFLEPSKVKERLYHGTITHDVYADKDEQAFQQFTGSPTWLAEEPYTANAYAGAKGTVYPVHAQIKKPLVLGFNADDDAKRAFPTAKRLGVDVEHIQRMHRPEQAWEVVNHPSFIDAAQKAGYDSIQMHEGDYKTHGVFDPRKIKSAIGNRGTYDTSNPDINMSKGGAVKGKVTMSPNMDVMQYELLNRKAK